ncbi:MAG: threonine aldolase, partial [Candidatus Thorarchaeota archaeon]|nr:threonine aldolase [Candidatus Thorarchaeota archaeon]
LIAAPGIVALEKMVDRLADDHANAKILYKAFSKIDGLIVDEPETNIIFVHLNEFSINAEEFSEELKKRGVLVYGEYGKRVRFVLNRMVEREDLSRVASAVEEILNPVGI